jgi:predicted methyltransferase
VHYPFFYYATSELFASYLREELIQLVVNDGGYHNSLVTGFMPEKELIYRKYFGELKNRLKTVGFEKITKFREEKENELASRFSDLNNYNMYMNINKIKSQLGI